MLTFLFWNLSRKPLAERVARIVLRHKVDVVILAECEIARSEMLKLLNSDKADYHFPFSKCDKVMIYTRFSTSFIKPKFENNRWTIRHLLLPQRQAILLAAVHLPSKLYWTQNSQASECIELAHEIRRVEQELGCTRTVLTGDLNLNPFESGIISANGLHAVMTRDLASRKQRKIQGRSYPFFYNPMWNRLGDETDGPPGTYFYERAEHNMLFWNTFDQVLLRPELLPYFKNEELQVLSSDGDAPLLSTKGIPDVVESSDHLPVLFKLHI